MKSIWALAFVVAVLMFIAPMVVMTPVRGQPASVQITVEPIAVPPLTDLNNSINGLETPATPSPVGQTFNVELHVIGATNANVSGLEVHFYFGDILTYAIPTGFTDSLGTAGWAMNKPVLEGLAGGFYDNLTNLISGPPYTGATYYEVAAASSGKPWNGADGLIAIITFQIIKQPLGSNGESTVNLPLTCDLTSLLDPNLTPIANDVVPGTLTIDATAAPAGQFTLTVNTVGSGTVTKNPSSGTYANGTIVTLTAAPDANWSFSSWSSDVTGTQNPVNVTMDGNKTVTATFTQRVAVFYNLTVNVVGNGNVTTSPLNTTFLSGTVVTLMANAGLNWTFFSWSGDLVGSQNPANLTMDGNKTVTATFVQGVQNYNLTINVVYVSNYTSYIQSGKILENASVTLNPAASSYPGGTVVNLTEVPSLNWTFWSWSGDLTGNESKTSVTMNGNKNITATFGLNWDLNHDGVISLSDLELLALSWYSTPNSPNWNPQADFAAPYGRISLTDLVTLAINYAWFHA